jgi:hypothetical protein
MQHGMLLCWPVLDLSIYNRCLIPRLVKGGFTASRTNQPRFDGRYDVLMMQRTPGNVAAMPPLLAADFQAVLVGDLRVVLNLC